MPIKDFLANAFGPSSFEDEAFKKLGTGAKIGSAVGVARGGTGTVDPLLEGRSNEELADLDRAQFARRNTSQNPVVGILGALGVAAGDTVKSIPGVTKGIGKLIKLAGGQDETVKEFTESNEHTSEPGLRQVLSSLRGAGQGLGDVFDVLKGGPGPGPGSDPDAAQGASDAHNLRAQEVSAAERNAEESVAKKTEQEDKQRAESIVPVKASDPEDRKKALINALKLPGDDVGGLAGVLAALGGAN